MERSPAARIGRVLLVGGFITAAVTVAAVSTGYLWLASLMPALLAGLTLLATGFVGIRHHHPLVMRLAALISGTMVVRVMDFVHEERLCLARDIGQGRWEAWWGWMQHSGHLVLLESGVVDPRCDACFCYAWRPLDPDLETQLILRADRWISWDQWRSMEHHQMLTTRMEILGNDPEH